LRRKETERKCKKAATLARGRELGQQRAARLEYAGPRSSELDKHVTKGGEKTPKSAPRNHRTHDSSILGAQKKRCAKHTAQSPKVRREGEKKKNQFPHRNGPID